MEDKDLDDLLESALSDFDKNKTGESCSSIFLSSNATTATKTVSVNNDNNSLSSRVSIEKMNLYVDDDLDYEDRPPASALLRPRPAAPPATSTTSSTPSQEASANNIDDDLKMFEEIFGDAKTTASMQHLKQTLDMFKQGDEAQLLANFDKVMSSITDTFQLDGDEIASEDDDNEIDENLGKEQATALLTKLLGDMSTTGVGVGPSTKTTKPTLSSSSASKDQTEKPLNPASFFNSEFLSKLSSKRSDENDELSQSEFSLMEPLLSMLFSKDILYPSLKMMLANFETYLAGIEKEDETTATETETETETDSGQKTEATEAERKKNKKKLTPSELAKCREQQQCILQMCRVYEGATENDSPQKKSEQLHKIINLLEKCGMPPSELIPEVNPFSGMGSGGLGSVSSSLSENCPIQ